MPTTSAVSPFSPCDTSSCCLCGSTQSLSGEHKIKAAVLRAEFGRQRLVIGRRDEGYRQAQGPGSKAFHFTAPLCAPCNNARTRPADLAFEELHAVVRQLSHDGKDPMTALDHPRFSQAGDLGLNVRRYFAKLLCCHLAELGAPRQVALSEFAIGRSDLNGIQLAMDEDHTWVRSQTESPGLPFAAHGGLVIFGDRQTFLPTTFYSTLTAGPVRYKYSASLTVAGQALMALETPEFFDWCRDRVRAGVAQPVSEEAKLVLGL